MVDFKGYTMAEMKKKVQEAYEAVQNYGFDGILLNKELQFEQQSVLDGAIVVTVPNVDFYGAVMRVEDKTTCDLLPVFFGEHSAYLWGYKDGLKHKTKDYTTWLQFKKTLKKEDYITELLTMVAPNVEGIILLYAEGAENATEEAYRCFEDTDIQKIKMGVNLISYLHEVCEEFIEQQIAM